MSEYLEIVEFTVERKDVGALLERRPAAIAALGDAFEGLIDARLAQFDDGSWVDVVRWRSREEAEAAAAGMPAIPAAVSWVAVIAQVTSMRHAAVRESGA